MKNQKGITLIALVITIIVLLILAGVSIAMLTGNNGLLTKANQSNTDTKIAEIRENVEVAISAAYTSKLAKDPTQKIEGLKASEIVEQINTTNGLAKDATSLVTATDGAQYGGTIEYKISAKETYTVTLTNDGLSISASNGIAKKTT